MRTLLRRRLERATRVRDFLRAHQPEGAAEAAALARLEAQLARADALAAQQRAGVVASQGATKKRTQVRRALQTTLLRYLAGVAAVAGKEAPELAAQLRLPRLPAPHQTLVTMAGAMLEQAAAHEALLVSRGMSATLLADLARAVAELEQTLEASRAGRRAHVGASADLEAVVQEIAVQVRLLDGLVRYRFGNSAELMGAWASARNVLGPFRSKAASEAPAGGAPQVVQPAA